MKKYILIAMLLACYLKPYAQPKIFTTGNNIINTTNPYAADVLIGSDTSGGIRHDASIMWWNNSSASRISNSGDLFKFSVWHTDIPNVALSAILGGASYFQGNLGIGTTNPQNKLDVDVTHNSEQKSVSVFGNTTDNTVNSPVGGLRFSWYGSNKAEIQMVRGIGASDGAGLSFHTSGEGGIPIERMRVDRTGNIGIGNINPTAKLDVNGDVRLSGYVNTDNAFVLNKPGKKWLMSYEPTGAYFYIDEFGTGRHFSITNGGNVGIGTTTPDAKLAVNGIIHSQGVKVDMNGWADHVFKPSYNLLSLSQVKHYIDQNKHLPDVPSEQEVAANGVNLGEMNKLLLKKVEELTLYLIEKDKQLKVLHKKTLDLEKRVKRVEKSQECK